VSAGLYSLAALAVIGAMLACIVWLARLDGRSKQIIEAQDAETAKLAEMDKVALQNREAARLASNDELDSFMRSTTKPN
jgi:Flp pilus assembly protein TadB